MATRPPKDRDVLLQRLERLSAALGPQPPAPVSRAPAPRRTGVGKVVRGTGVALGVMLVATGISIGIPEMIVFGLTLVVLAAIPRLTPFLDSLGLGRKDPTRAHIGAGADVAQDAVIEPGAVVEMGATVGPGAVVKSGAVVRMGATVKARAVLEEGASVGWGADVEVGATVGQGAIVGAGATVREGASVPAGTRIGPGGTWSRGTGARAATSAAPSVPQKDPREARILAACDRIETELRQAPASAREYLAISDETVRALRDTCLGLLRREKAIRAECSPESLAFLDTEKAELERRIAAATDESVRRSLTQAVAAIDDQRRQRGLLLRSAERLDAEITRLMWTLDGMGAQLVRLRTAGVEVAVAPDEVLRSMEQLHGEIDAIADALDQVAHDEAVPPERISPVGEEVTAPTSPRTRERT